MSKNEHGGRVSDAQRDIGALLPERGAPYELAIGRDQPIEILRRWGALR